MPYFAYLVKFNHSNENLMYKTNRFLLFCLIWSFQFQLQAQTISGTITDQEGAGIENVLIQVQGNSIATLSDANGIFSIENLPGGTQILEINQIGYANRTDTLKFNGTDLVLDLILTPDPLDLQSVVVTGTYQTDKKLNAPVSITTLSTEDISIRNARGTADLLKAIPGVYVDASAGEVYTRVYTRGVASSAEDDLGWYYVSLQEDGLPVTLVQYGYYSPDLFHRADLTTHRVEAIRGGSAAITGVNAPGGIFNFISKRGNSNRQNELETTVGIQGDGNLLGRLDGNFSGALGKKNWAYNIGGFYRYDQGPRNTDYPWAKGGQLKANVSKTYKEGQLNFYVKYLNDQTNRYLGLATTDWNNPRPAFGQNFNTTALSLPSVSGDLPDPRNRFDELTPQTRSFNSNNGIRTKDFAAGFYLTNQLKSGWIMENRFKVSRKSANWQNSISSVRLGLDNFITYFLGNNFNSFGQVVFRDPATGAERARINNLGALGPFSDPPIAPSFEYLTDDQLPNDAVLGTALWHKLDKVTDLMYKVNLKRNWTHHRLNVGLFAGHSGVNSFTQGSFAYATFENEPKMLQVSLENPGTDVIQLSDENGIANYGGLFYNNALADVAQVQLAASDTWQVNSKLRLDFGASFEYTNHTGIKDRSNGTAIPGGEDEDLNTAYDNFTLVPELQKDSFDFAYSLLNFSLGINYKLDKQRAIFGRFTRSNKAPELNYYFNNFENIPIDQKGRIQHIKQAELGFKQQNNTINIFATAFWSQLDNIGFSEFVFDQSGMAGIFFTPEQINKTTTIGLELETNWQPLPSLNLRFLTTLQKATATTFTVYDTAGTFDIEDDQVLDYSGNELAHQPKLTLEFIPSYQISSYQIFAAWRYLGERQANVANAYQLPGFSMFRAGVSGRISKNVSLSLICNNLFNSTGLMYSFGPNEFGSSSNAATPEFITANPDASFIVVPVLPRTVVMKVGYKF